MNPIVQYILEAIDIDGEIENWGVFSDEDKAIEAYSFFNEPKNEFVEIRLVKLTTEIEIIKGAPVE